MIDQDAEMAAHRADAKERVFATASIIALVIVLVVSLGVWCVMSWSSVGFEKMFVEMGTTLPTLTVFIMTPGFQMIVPVLAIAGLIKEIVIRNRLITFMINGIHICVLILLVVVWQLALFLPLIDLMEMMGEA